MRIDCTPERAANTIIHSAAKNRRKIFDALPMPSQIIDSGINASGGIGRMNSTMGSKNPRMIFDKPMAKPMGMPSRQPKKNPTSRRYRLMPRCSHSVKPRKPSVATVMNCPSTSVGGGMNIGLASSRRTASDHRAKMRTTETMLHSKPPVAASGSPKVTALRSDSPTVTSPSLARAVATPGGSCPSSSAFWDVNALIAQMTAAICMATKSRMPTGAAARKTNSAMRSATNKTTPPSTVAYSNPIGPSSSAKRSATPKLLGDAVAVTVEFVSITPPPVGP